MDGLDEFLAGAVVSDEVPRRLDAAAERGVRDDAAFPDLLDQLVPGHDVIAVFNQDNQELQNLGLEGQRLTPARDFKQGGIDLIVAESVYHVGPHKIHEISKLTPHCLQGGGSVPVYLAPRQSPTQ